MIPLLSLLLPSLIINEHLTIYPIIPSEAAQGWKVELFELSEPIPPHFHKIQRQFVLVTKGTLQVFLNHDESILAQTGELVQIEPGIVHALTPQGKARFLTIDFPAHDFPDDVYDDQPDQTYPWVSPLPTASIPPIDEKYYGAKFDAGEYLGYGLVDGSATNNQWSAALLELRSSPKHYHLIETEHFIVVAGTLAIEIDGEQHLVEMGSSVTISPGQIHQLKSLGDTPARLLCFNFPAFNPTDLYCIE